MIRGLIVAAQARYEAATSEDDVRALTAELNGLVRRYQIATGQIDISLPDSPVAQAVELDPGYRLRPHVQYVSDRIRDAVAKVEAGESQFLIIEQPPRTGKTTLTTLVSPTWILRKHPDWPVGLVSHDPGLATSWGRQIRRWVEQKPLGLTIAPDAGAVSAWETTEGGSVLSVSIRQSFTGRGVKVLVIDDPHKDFADAHSETSRQAVWDWWLAVAQLRLEPPVLVMIVMARWHEDDLVARLLSDEYEGDPTQWQVISLPGLADREDDPLGRAEGEPLLTPLLDETVEEATSRWKALARSVGSYVFGAMVQQRPAPSKGAIFDMDKVRYWSANPNRATEDGSVIHWDPRDAKGGRWLDSWDCAFKATDGSDYVVGSRWHRVGVKRLLVDQRRARLTFSQTVAAMEDWITGGVRPELVHQRLVEDKANGTAVIDVLKEKISGLLAVNPTQSKEARARAVTPEWEAGNVYLPHPSDPGHEWVTDLLSELRGFPHGAHDDQVDALTQALMKLRDPGTGSLTVPGRLRPSVPGRPTAGSRAGNTRQVPRRALG